MNRAVEVDPDTCYGRDCRVIVAKSREVPLSECGSLFPANPFIELNTSGRKVQLPRLEKWSSKSMSLTDIVAKARPLRISTIAAIRRQILDFRKPLGVPTE
jgi:hypothetical protein